MIDLAFMIRDCGNDLAKVEARLNLNFSKRIAERNAWEKTAAHLERERDELRAALKRIAEENNECDAMNCMAEVWAGNALKNEVPK